MAAVSLLINGTIFGLGAAIPIGPVNIEIARRSLRRGFPAGLAIGCGAVTVDVTYCVLYTVGIAESVNNPLFYRALGVLGIAMLCFLGVMSLRGAREAARIDVIGQTAVPSLHGGYLTGLLMTATNPMTLGFWFTVLPGFAGTITAQPRHDLPIICLGVFIGAMGWVVFFAGLLSLAGKLRKPWWLTAADEVGGVMLLGMAAWRFCVLCKDLYNAATT